MKNHKGILLPEGLKIIVAVLCIVLLIYLAASLYSLFIAKSKLTQARATLKEISANINKLEDGSTGNYLVVAPKDWVLISKDKKLCCCDRVSLNIGSAFFDCQKSGVCQDLNLNIKLIVLDSVFNALEFSKIPMTIFFSRQGDTASLGTEDYSVIKSHLDTIINENKGELSQYIYSADPSKETEVKNTLEKNLNNFYSKIDTMKLFGIKKELFQWKFEILKDGKQILELHNKQEINRVFLSWTSEEGEFYFKLSYYSFWESATTAM